MLMLMSHVYLHGLLALLREEIMLNCTRLGYALRVILISLQIVSLIFGTHYRAMLSMHVPFMLSSANCIT